MMEDILKSLGYRCLGSRMKRIGERLQAEAQALLDGLPVSVQASQHPFLAALDRLGPLTVGELAAAIGITQPGVTRSVARLAGLGLVAARPAAGDQRQRIVSLTPAGRRLVDTAKRDAWLKVERAVADLCAGLGGPLLDQLAAIEDRLAAVPLDRRVACPAEAKAQP
jgi:DNA-binding MarR family transcriptional regulator